MNAPHFRAIVSCALVVAFDATSAPAQAFSAATGLSGARLTPNACAIGRSQARITSDLIGDWSLARVSWSGRVASDLTGGAIQSSTLKALVQTPMWRGWRLDAGTQREVGDAECGGSAALRTYATGVSYQLDGSGVALRYMKRLTRHAGGLGADTLTQKVVGPTTRGVSLTAWHNLGRTLLAMSLGSRGQWREERVRIPRVVNGGDTIPTDSGPVVIPGPGITYETALRRALLHDFGTELRATWTGGPLSFDAMGGRALGGSRLWDGRYWGRAEGSVALTPSVALFAAAVDDGRDSHFTVPRRYFTLGLRLTSTPFGRPADEMKEGSRAVAGAFRLHADPNGIVTLAIRSADARVVELTGDFLQWKPVRMQRVSPDWWEVRLRMSAGVHRVNVRVDGGKWRAPPGVPRQRDEFGGDAGVIVIP
ncbi:MAG TPA: glycogen-binding domain-containing protein [Gemmatimonadaceae bacterium]|nr:glycogen-binding domain-containing protein [Gemmatimonadaceae bacterium]